MIPLYRCREIEPAVDLLGKNFRHVILNSVFNVRSPMRVRCDLLRSAIVYFAKTDSQRAAWKENGGILYVFLKKNYMDPTEGTHDAQFFVECPRTVDMLDEACQETRHIAVVFDPPPSHWKELEHTVGRISSKKKSERLAKREWDRLYRVRELIARAPLLTPEAIATLLQDRGLQPQPSSAPVPHEVLERVIHRVREVP